MKLVLIGALFALAPAVAGAQSYGVGYPGGAGMVGYGGGYYGGGLRLGGSASASASASVAIGGGYGYQGGYYQGGGYGYTQPYYPQPAYPQPYGYSYAYPTGGYVMSYSYPVVQSAPTVVYSGGYSSGCGCQGGYGYGW